MEDDTGLLGTGREMLILDLRPLADIHQCDGHLLNTDLWTRREQFLDTPDSYPCKKWSWAKRPDVYLAMGITLSTAKFRLQGHKYAERPY